ncbi:lytic polysaccharide monooxygenase [Daldinia sp. FL1419]|nr:lytic polysaccharide monooxygenase [Daldinia sp. FL1419]
MKSISVLISVAAIAKVYGHGGVYNYTIDGVDYPGHYPWLPEEGQVSIQRRWWPDPIYQTDHPYLACNRGNPLANTTTKLHATVRPGSEIVAFVLAPPCPDNPPVPFPTTPSVPEYGDDKKPMTCHGPEYPWPHALGPMFVYMADCQGPCDEWDGSGKRWFKIWEAGYNPKGWEGAYEYGTDKAISSGDRWWQTYAAGAWSTIPKVPWNVTIPNLKPGNYLIRHEIVNLEASLQFYPECAQLEVVGDGDAVPPEEYLVQFPGAYSADDPGFWMAGQMYNPKVGHSIFNYTIPGPKVWDPSKA